jgi:AraC family transcriptional activator of pobA
MHLIKILNEKNFFEKAKPGNLFRPSGFSIIFMIEGFIQLEINGKLVFYEKEHVVLISPQNIYKLIHYSDTLKIYILIHNREAVREKINFDFNRYDAYREINAEKNYNILKLEKIVFDQLLGLVNLLHYHINSITKKSSFREQIIIAVFSTIIYTLIDTLTEKIYSDSKFDSRKEEITILFIEMVSEHFKTEKELSFYAEKLHISIKYLSISVKETTNTPPTTFIANTLLNEAKVLLLSTKKTISIIAAELNFSDQYAFGKFFKKHTDLSPRNYRNRNKTTLIDTI